MKCNQTFLRLSMALLLFSGGCASFKVPLPGGPDVAVERQKREQQVIDQYEQKRNATLYQASLTQLQDNNSRGARETAELLVGRSPNHRGARLLLADIDLMQQDYAGAKRNIDAVLDQDPKDAAALHAMGLLLDASGDVTQASEYLGRAAQLDPDNEIFAVSYQSVVESQQGGDPLSLVAPKDPARHRASDLAACAESSVCADWLHQAAQALEAHDSQAAIAALDQALAIEPENRKIPNQAALLALRSNQSDVAARVLRKAIATLPPSAENYRTLGLAFYRQGDYNASQVALQQALSLDNRDPLAYFLMGFALERLGRREAAQQNFLSAGRLDPTLSRPRR